MSTIKSSSEHLTLNADGASKDIKFQANGVEKASISSAGLFTSTTIDATKLTGNLPAISGASLTGLPAGGKVLQVVQDRSATSFTVNATDTKIMETSLTTSGTNSSFLITVSWSHHLENVNRDVCGALGYKTGSSSSTSSDYTSIHGTFSRQSVSGLGSFYVADTLGDSNDYGMQAMNTYQILTSPSIASGTVVYFPFWVGTDALVYIGTSYWGGTSTATTNLDMSLTVTEIGA